MSSPIFVRVPLRASVFQSPCMEFSIEYRICGPSPSMSAFTTFRLDSCSFRSRSSSSTCARRCSVPGFAARNVCRISATRCDMHAGPMDPSVEAPSAEFGLERGVVAATAGLAGAPCDLATMAHAACTSPKEVPAHCSSSCNFACTALADRHPGPSLMHNVCTAATNSSIPVSLPAAAVPWVGSERLAGFTASRLPPSTWTPTRPLLASKVFTSPLLPFRSGRRVKEWNTTRLSIKSAMRRSSAK
mmetsp:Transcript_22070/g.69334  ORF Transcript_22070/g.69334 Transcript_22070/m.69334 type:complete len:245 (+) Transcript_22070:270-1004(+)